MSVLKVLAETAEEIKIFKNPNVDYAKSVLGELLTALTGYNPLEDSELVDLWFGLDNLYVKVGYHALDQLFTDLYELPINALIAANPTKELRRLRLEREEESLEQELKLLNTKIVYKNIRLSEVLKELDEL